MKRNRTFFSALLCLSLSLSFFINSLFSTPALAQEVEIHTQRYQHCTGTMFPEAEINFEWTECSVATSFRETDGWLEVVGMEVLVPSLNLRVGMKFGEGFFGHKGGGLSVVELTIDDDVYRTTGNGGCAFLPLNYQRGMETRSFVESVIDCSLEAKLPNGSLFIEDFYARTS